MGTLNRIGGVLAGLMVAGSVWAAPQVATLEDGRQVVLHDDFTWQYVVPVEQRQHPVGEQKTETKPDLVAPVAPAVPAVITAVPVVSATKGVQFTVGENKNIQQLSRSGVDVLLRPASYRNGELVIPTSLTNQSTESVVLVEVDVTVYNPQGRELANQQSKIWTSVKRMAETYFRPKTQEEGKAIVVKVPEAKEYFIKTEIIEVEHW
ncbi:DUF3157 family protein [Photobacterium alginatilyticum]|uniref:DUF3157 family protein n=1 Tax=Photobacterium alginatilyticum TaxID=1775171 RepID=A0ABW9YGB1_9GAMM|nr:DUF3157 family protein [Photobacterium alginatilyticum]NBI52616.1 DUF3157 family protein [Photobacterium alginatilyticum]